MKHCKENSISLCQGGKPTASTFAERLITTLPKCPPHLWLPTAIIKMSHLKERGLQRSAIIIWKVSSSNRISESAWTVHVSRKAASLTTTTRTTTQVSRILSRPEVTKTNPYLQAQQSLSIITLTQPAILSKSKGVKACHRSNTHCKRISQATPGLPPTKKRHSHLATSNPRPQNSKRRWEKA